MLAEGAVGGDVDELLVDQVDQRVVERERDQVQRRGPVARVAHWEEWAWDGAIRRLFNGERLA